MMYIQISDGVTEDIHIKKKKKKDFKEFKKS